MKVLIYSSAAIFLFAFMMQFHLLWDHYKAGRVKSIWIFPIRLKEYVQDPGELRTLRISRAVQLVSFFTLLACFAISIIASISARRAHSLRTWPDELPAQAAALSSVLATVAAPAYVATIAGHFEGKKTKKRLEEVTRLLETLEALGRAVEREGGWVSSG